MNMLGNDYIHFFVGYKHASCHLLVVIFIFIRHGVRR